MAHNIIPYYRQSRISEQFKEKDIVSMNAIPRREVLRYLGASAATASLGLITAHSADNSNHSTSPASGTSFELVVYGGTPSGIMAAVAAAQQGLSVALVETTGHVGGILTSGLGVTDSDNYNYIGGLTARFHRDLGSMYGSTQPAYCFEPHVAESVFDNYLLNYKIEVILNDYLTGITKSKHHITSITLASGKVLSASQWIDASYEGDLLAASGVSYVVGRESQQQYGESLAGWGVNQNVYTMSPYDSNGNLLACIQPLPNEGVGRADAEIMGYTFRSCLTNLPSNMIPFPEPPDYSPDQFAALSRFLSFNKLGALDEILDMQPTVKSKFNLLFADTFNPFSSNYTGYNWAYPNASPADRKTIWNNHYKYVAGLLYFLANDASVPKLIRSEINTFGLAADEFTDNGNWPWQMYVREGRRMLGQAVMTQSDVMSLSNVPDSIGVGEWSIDCQQCGNFAGEANGSPAVITDGYIRVATQPYQIPFRAILPRGASEAVNLAVTCCLSASHIAFCSLRVEPVFMTLGEAAGTAASIAVKNNKDIRDVKAKELQPILISNGGILQS